MTVTEIGRYAESLPDMPGLDLLAELSSSVRQNKYGSHSLQIAMIEREILKRMS